MPLDFPVVNGEAYSFASVTLLIGGSPFRAVKSIDYSNAVERQHVTGTGQLPFGRTAGMYKGDMSVEIWREQLPDFLELLGDGYMQVEFDVEVQFQARGQEMQEVYAQGVALNKDSASMTNSADGLAIKLELDVLRPIRINGLYPVVETPTIAGGGLGVTLGLSVG